MSLPITYEELWDLESDKKMWLKVLANSPLFVVPWFVQKVLENKSWIKLWDNSIVSEDNPTLLDFPTYEQLPDEFRSISSDEKKQLIALMTNNWKSNKPCVKTFKKVKELYEKAIEILINDFHIKWSVIKKFEWISFKRLESFVDFIDNNPYKSSISWRFLHCSILKMMLILNSIETAIDFSHLQMVTDYIKTTIKNIDWVDVLQEKDNELSVNLSFADWNWKKRSTDIDFIFDEKSERSVILKLLAKRKYQTVDAIKDLVRFKVKVEETWDWDEMEQYYIKILELILEKLFSWEIEVEQNHIGTYHLIESKYFDWKPYKYNDEERNIENINITWSPSEKSPKVIWVKYIEAQIVSSVNTNDEKWHDSRPFYEWVDKILVWTPRLLNYWIATMWNIKYAVRQIVKTCKEQWIWDFNEIFVLSKIFHKWNIFPVNVIKMHWNKWKWTVAFWIKWAFDEKVLSKLYWKVPTKVNDLSWSEIREMYEKTRIEY